ncbi:MAG: c-type cytochrome [Arcobacter sp.]|jgi:cytochrome c553|uniref:Periplasmic monoheme cytochrome c553 n=1 Tax=Arcobacter defluvii TaxID=873191 RepID=A0AAE7E5E5_9BACT|nr:MULTISPECIES: c-type cytochrome [Arcobacter]MDY3200493.1 c-type cytochrome [Arcobacter sp.]QKF76730.1 periplasmic monoheme cytochrome c553 [Arcobacter defluvii]RXI34872.1 cytochrome C [Arcobacter defluvii]BAK72542.1 cytochrome c-553 [Arcobacter sp. L]
MKKIVLATLAVATLALADAPAAYNTCKACHGAKGEINITTQSKSHVPANLAKADVEKALHGYKDGTYGGPMKGIMKGQVMKLSDADIKALAEYIGK